MDQRTGIASASLPSQISPILPLDRQDLESCCKVAGFSKVFSQWSYPPHDQFRCTARFLRRNDMRADWITERRPAVIRWSDLRSLRIHVWFTHSMGILKCKPAAHLDLGSEFHFSNFSNPTFWISSAYRQAPHNLQSSHLAQMASYLGYSSVDRSKRPSQ